MAHPKTIVLPIPSPTLQAPHAEFAIVVAADQLVPSFISDDASHLTIEYPSPSP